MKRKLSRMGLKFKKAAALVFLGAALGFGCAITSPTTISPVSFPIKSYGNDTFSPQILSVPLGSILRDEEPKRTPTNTWSYGKNIPMLTWNIIDGGNKYSIIIRDDYFKIDITTADGKVINTHHKFPGYYPEYNIKLAINSSDGALSFYFLPTDSQGNYLSVDGHICALSVKVIKSVLPDKDPYRVYSSSVYFVQSDKPR